MRVICRNVDKAYPSVRGSIVAVKDLSFETAESEFVCIVGPSGCGKTTLLKIVAGLLEPSQGHVQYEGLTHGAPLNAMVFQTDSIFPWMTVRENVAFPLETRGIPLEVREKLAAELIDRVGLRRFAANYPHELSTGMKQRVGIARAMVCSPEVLLMDEPFAALDAQMKAVMQEELLTLWGERHCTVLYVTHDIEEAGFLGDRVLVMSRNPGRIIADVPVEFPRPREHKLRNTAEFGELKEQIWLMIRDEVMQVLSEH